MPTPYKRVDWNAQIDAVNSVLENPPDGCDPIAPLPHVDPEHRWAKSDIRAMQDAIKETCPEITFNEIDPLWKQSTLDEINAKLADAWCDCECCDRNESSGDGAFTILASGSTALLATLDDMISGDVQVGHVLTSQGFTEVFDGDALSTLVTQSSPATGQPPTGSQFYSFSISIQVFDNNTSRWRGTSLSDSVGCYGTAFQDSEYNLFLSGKYKPERVVTATGSLATRYSLWRLAVSWSYVNDDCEDCTDDPRAFCPGGG